MLMSPVEIYKTAVTTSFDLFEFVRMPFCLKGESSTFQSYMDTVLANVANVDPYIDDLIVTSETEEQHMSELKPVFQVFSNNILKISLIKIGVFQRFFELFGFSD